MLKMTGSASAEEIAGLVDCSIEDENFWQKGIDIIAEFVDQFENIP